MQGEKPLDLTLFDFSDKVGAFITYLLIQSMNPESKITGNTTSDGDKDLELVKERMASIENVLVAIQPLLQNIKPEMLTKLQLVETHE